MVHTSRAVILAAGASRRLNGINEGLPKCLLNVQGQTIFDRQVSNLIAVGVEEIVLVVGFAKEVLIEKANTDYPSLRWIFVENSEFAETNTSYSLWLATPYLARSAFYYLNADVVFGPRLLKSIKANPAQSCLAVIAKPCGPEEVKVIVDSNDRILRIGKDLEISKCKGEFTGIARFGPEIEPFFFGALENLATRHERQKYFEAALDAITENHILTSCDVTSLGSIEIDFAEDVLVAQRMRIE